jgi:hypothetical protein
MSLFITYLSQTRLMYNPEREHSHPYVNRLKKDTKNPHKSIALIYAKDPIIECGIFQGKLFKKGETDPSVAQWSFNLGPKINDGLFPKRNIATSIIDKGESISDRLRQKREQSAKQKAAADAIIANQKAAEKIAKAEADAEAYRQREEKKKQILVEKARKEKEKAEKDKAKKEKEKNDRAKRQEILISQQEAFRKAETERAAMLKVAEEELRAEDEERERQRKVVQTKESEDRQRYLERKRSLEMREKEAEELLDLERREQEVQDRLERLERSKQLRRQQASAVQQSIPPNQQHEQMPTQGSGSRGMNQTPHKKFQHDNMYAPSEFHTPDDYYDDRYDRYSRSDRPVANSSRDQAYHTQQSWQRPLISPRPMNMESHNGVSFVFNTSNYQSSSNNQY